LVGTTLPVLHAEGVDAVEAVGSAPTVYFGGPVELVEVPELGLAMTGRLALIDRGTVESL
jgi:hypothetical protein